MDELVYYFDNQIKVPSNSYIITFDDGFENNYSIAAEILEKYSTPATFAVSTNLIQKSYELVDQIEHCIESINNISIFLPWRNEAFDLKNNEDKIECLESIRQNVKLNQDLFVPEEIVKSIFNQCNRN